MGKREQRRVKQGGADVGYIRERKRLVPVLRARTNLHGVDVLRERIAEWIWVAGIAELSSWETAFGI